MQTTEHYTKIDIPYIIETLDIDTDKIDLAESEISINDILVRFTAIQNVNKKGEKHIFFICPNTLCNKPRRHLYMIPHGDDFVPLCRKCANLKYPTQNLNGVELAREAIKRQLEKMGVENAMDLAPAECEKYKYLLPPRRPGQHEKSYQRECETLKELFRREKREFIKWCERRNLLGAAVASGLLVLDNDDD